MATHPHSFANGASQMGYTKAHCRRGGQIKRLAETLMENCLRQSSCNICRAWLIRPSCCGGTCIVFFLLLRMSQRWRGLNAIGHSTGQRVAVMHPLGILSFIETSTAATLWVGSSATDKLCATLRNPARSHHPVFPEWGRSSAHLQTA